MGKINFAIDRGGTFTDVYATYNNKIYTRKILSVNPLHYDNAPREGIRQILEEIEGFPIDPNSIPTEKIASIRMGTTVATNALLERNGEHTALLITKGFADTLDIRYQNRPDIFALNIIKSSPLHEISIEIDERVIPHGEEFQVLKSLDLEEVKKTLLEVQKNGITSIAVVLMHAYGYTLHEELIGKMALELGFKQVSLSHKVIQAMKLIERADTTVVDAYLTPHVQEYIDKFEKGFQNSLKDVELLFMQSSGGLKEAHHFRGSNAIMSGPAGGVVGYSCAFKTSKALIGFDMGGTSTDVSRYDGKHRITYDNLIDGIHINQPHIDILTVAAGGGSRLFYKHGMFVVGPESAGSNPGPLCYAKDGYLSITDANLVTGKIRVEYFPHIFGKNQNDPLCLECAKKGFQELQLLINSDNEKKGMRALSIEEIANGFLDIANELMIAPIKEVSVSRGFDVREHALVSFGGAASQHACAIAKKLEMKEVLISPYSAILSAFGISTANKSELLTLPINIALNDANMHKIEEKFGQLYKEFESSHSFDYTHINRFLNLRFDKEQSTIRIVQNSDFKSAFLAEHKRIFGFTHDDRDIVVESAEVEFINSSTVRELPKIKKSTTAPVYEKRVQMWVEDDFVNTPIYLLKNLYAQDMIEGPAIIADSMTTIIVEPNCSAKLDEYGNVIISIKTQIEKKQIEKNPITLSLFSSLFMSIASQMGKMLQRTAVSTNIKERLDFSCALFDRKGNLVANAPHIPVHLGSMSYAVKAVIERYKNFSHGDVYIGNDPSEGGSHLPDITVITVYKQSSGADFFVASRGHHADIGGIAPGSMPSNSTTLQEEGAIIKFFPLVKNGYFDQSKLTHILKEAGARSIEDNLADIKAQISANKKGIELLYEMSQKYTLKQLHDFMNLIQKLSAQAIRKLLKNFEGKRVAEDRMDDGSVIKVTIDINDGKALFDFEGTSPQSSSNQNIPLSVVNSAIIYVLRVLIDDDFVLNEGFLEPVEIKVPYGSMLNPSSNAPVVAGNVTTSQRIVDVVLKAFNVAGASCGCMNNISFGNEQFGFYETIGGGSGATKDMRGADAVHTHMTNTRITDAEIVEQRYKVKIDEFSIRRDSGGEGKHRGGNGIIRQIEFLEPVKVNLLTQRRVFAPYGSHGASDGAKGKNILIRGDEQILLKSNEQFEAGSGDKLRIETPGGGGYG